MRNRTHGPAQNRRVYTIELPNRWRAEFFALPISAHHGRIAHARQTTNVLAQFAVYACQDMASVALPESVNVDK
ncbi:MAG TPA: hypothetical protein VK673_14615 [Chthoniobacterales bacterium]|nr:hypothetical protein [Chthoniobacterales bacterium]